MVTVTFLVKATAYSNAGWIYPAECAAETVTDSKGFGFGWKMGGYHNLCRS
ncbi:MAG: hypothetical protein LBB89_03310 [Treponema sp.]|nr:hypothetical protein [Treponema sp.]